MQLGTIESIWRYPVKGMRGEEIPHTYTAFTGLMGDRVYGVVAADSSSGNGNCHRPNLIGPRRDTTQRV